MFFPTPKIEGHIDTDEQQAYDECGKKKVVCHCI
jgi:hypothetical protein